MRIRLEKNSGLYRIWTQDLCDTCTGVTDVMGHGHRTWVIGSNPVQAWIFFQTKLHYYLSVVHICEDNLPYSFLPLQFTYMIFIYLQSFIDWNPFQTLRAGLQLKSIHVHQSIKAYDINGAFYANYTKIGAFSLLHLLFSRVLVVSCCLLLSVRQYPSFWLKLFFENILSDEYFWFLIGVYCLILRKNWTLFAKFRNGVSDISFYFSLLNRESNLIVKLLCAE